MEETSESGIVRHIADDIELQTIKNKRIGKERS